MSDGFGCETCGATLVGAPLACPNGHPLPPPVPNAPTPAQPAPPGLAPRPDPYAQITNPLHTNWGQGADPGGTTPAPAPLVARPAAHAVDHTAAPPAPTPEVPPTAPPAPPPAPPGLAPRPDPYAQITNPLHTGWGTGPAPSAAPPPPLPPPSPRPPTDLGKWVRRVIAVVVLVLAAGVLWVERDRIGDLVDDLADRNAEQSSPAQPSVVDGRSDISVGSLVAHASRSPITT